MTVLTDKQWRSTGSMQSYSLKNSPRSTLLLLLRVAGAKKVNNLCIGLIDCFFTIAGIWYLYLGPAHDSYLSTTRHNLDPKENIPNFKITWCNTLKFTSFEIELK